MHKVLTYQGGCHCGNVRFEFTAEPIFEATRCNCSMCSRNDFLHIFVPHRLLTLLSDPKLLTEYRFNTGAAQHLFCSQCGVKAYYQPRSHPDCWSVNARCIDDLDIQSLQLVEFDGRHWSSARQGLVD